MLGQDVGRMGGVFGVTRGLYEEFGARPGPRHDPERDLHRRRRGRRGDDRAIPVAELQFADFMLIAGDEVFHKMAKWRYMHGGQLSVPMVAASADRRRSAASAPNTRSRLEALGMHFPGLKVALPATPADAKGLLKTAIRDPNPVLFFEHKGMYRVKGPVPEDPEFLVPFGEAAVRRRGAHLTVVATGPDGRPRPRGGRDRSRPRASSSR